MTDKPTKAADHKAAVRTDQPNVDQLSPSDDTGPAKTTPGPDHIVKPVINETQNEDHPGRIRELAMELRNASPSGANSISDKILHHLDAIADPKGYNERQAKEKKVLDDAEKVRADERAKLKPKAVEAHEKAKEKENA